MGFFAAARAAAYPLLLPSAHPLLSHPDTACLLLLGATLAAAQDTPAADPTSISLKPVLRPSFKRNTAGEYDVPATATTDYGSALQTALAKWAGVKEDAVSVTPGTPVVASKPGSKVVEGGVTCAGPNVCMPFEANIKAANEKAANKLRDALKDGKLDGLSSALKSATGSLKTADGSALPVARGFNLGSIDGKATSRTLDLASLSSASKKGLSTGALAGIIIGSVVGALLLCGLIWALCCRGSRASTAAPAAAAAPAGNAKLGATGGAATGAAATTGARAPAITTTTTATAATDAKLGGAGARSGGDRAAAAGTTTAAMTAATTAATAAARAANKPQSSLAKLASSLSGRSRSKSTDAVDKVVDKVVDAAERV